jgi:hypothetical protein
MSDTVKAQRGGVCGECFVGYRHDLCEGDCTCRICADAQRADLRRRLAAAEPTTRLAALRATPPAQPVRVEVAVTAVLTDLGTYFVAACDCGFTSDRFEVERYARRMVISHASTSGHTVGVMTRHSTCTP